MDYEYPTAPYTSKGIRYLHKLIKRQGIPDFVRVSTIDNYTKTVITFNRALTPPEIAVIDDLIANPQLNDYDTETDLIIERDFSVQLRWGEVVAVNTGIPKGVTVQRTIGSRTFTVECYSFIIPTIGDKVVVALVDGDKPCVLGKVLGV